MIGAARSRTGHQQMLGALLAQFPQHLFTHGCYPIDCCCRRDQCTHAALLVGGQSGAPVKRRH